MKILCAVALLLTSASPAAQNSQPTEGDAKESEREICKISMKTGSRVIRERTCRTAREWEGLVQEATREKGDSEARARLGTWR
jgi:hypothetical protein